MYVNHTTLQIVQPCMMVAKQLSNSKTSKSYTYSQGYFYKTEMIYDKTFEGKSFRGFHDFYSTANILHRIVYYVD